MWEILINLIDLENVAIFLGGLGAGYLAFKFHLGKLKNLVDAIDEAVEDDRITIEEASKIYDALIPFLDVVKTWIASRKR